MAGAVMVKVFATESFPAAPLPFNVTPIVGRVESLVEIIAAAESIGPSGVKTTVSACDCPGARLKEPGVTVKTEARDGGLITTWMVPTRFPFPEFLMLKVWVVDCPRPTALMFTAPGAATVAPLGTGVGVRVGIGVGVAVAAAVEVAVTVGVIVAVAVAVGVGVGLGLTVGVAVVVVVGVAVGVAVTVAEVS
jgi:hypothetical protein